MSRFSWLGFLLLLASLWIAAQYFGVSAKLGDHLPTTLLSCALVLLPYWFFGFRKSGTAVFAHPSQWYLLAPLLLLVPYLVFALPRHGFRWDMFLGMGAVVIAITLVLSRANPAEPGWHDWLVLAILGISVDLHFFDRAWPIQGLSSMPKLLFVDAGLYAYLVIRPIGGIGYDFRPRWSDLRIGLREFLFFTPAAIALGFALRFLHFHPALASPLWFGSGWVFTLFFIAVPETLLPRPDAEHAGTEDRDQTCAAGHVAALRLRAFQQARRVL